MSETRQTEEMSRAVREFTDAARELTAAVDRLSGLLERQERGYVPGEALREMLGSGGLPEEEAVALADKVVHEVREGLAADRKPERGPLTAEEIEDYRKRRDARRGFAEGA